METASEERLQDRLLLNTRSSDWFLPQNIDAAVAVGEEEHVVVVVPRDLVHLELELLFRLGAMRLGVDEGHHIIFISNSDGLTVWAPADVDVLTLKRENT